MPASDGRMSPAEIRAFQAWLMDHGFEDSECSFCGHTGGWNTAGSVVQTPSYVASDQGARFGARTFAHVFVVCNGCGHEVFFDAEKLGIVEYGEESDG